MNCPVDGAQLAMNERQGIEIDYCPQCRGIWLDRGELDKVIERSAQAMPQSQAQYRESSGPRYSGHPSQKHRKSSWLSELFD